MGKKRDRYVEQGYVEKVEHALYNNLPVPEYIYEGRQSVIQFNKANLENMLLEDEEWVQLEHDRHIVITNKARLLNTHRNRPMPPRISNTTLHAHVAGHSVPFKQYFEDNGWTFDVDQIKSDYQKYNWKHQDVYTRRKRRK